MLRTEFILHLTNQECYPDEECTSTVSQLWHNAINNQSCYVPYEDELANTTWGQIVWELKIDPPLEYDADYHVYLGWREHYEQKLKEINAKKEL